MVERYGARVSLGVNLGGLNDQGLQATRSCAFKCGSKFSGCTRGWRRPLAVESCELLGADNLIHGRWGAHDVTVRLGHGDRPRNGEVMPVALLREHLHFFDPATGKRAF